MDPKREIKLQHHLPRYITTTISINGVDLGVEVIGSAVATHTTVANLVGVLIHRSTNLVA